MTPDSLSTGLATLKQASESAQPDGAAACFGALIALAPPIGFLLAAEQPTISGALLFITARCPDWRALTTGSVVDP